MKVEPIRYANELDMGCEKKEKQDQLQLSLWNNYKNAVTIINMQKPVCINFLLLLKQVLRNSVV